jgi:hypothetical protein
MYETLPKTGLAVGIGGAAIGLPWLLAIGLTIVVAGILLVRYGRGRA